MKKLILVAAALLISTQAFAGIDLVIRKGLQFSHVSRCGEDDCANFPHAFRFQSNNLRCVLIPNDMEYLGEMDENFVVTKSFTVNLPLFESTEDVSYEEKCIERKQNRCMKKEVTSIIRQGFEFGGYHEENPYSVACVGVGTLANIESFDEESARELLMNLKNPFIQFE